MAKKAFEYFAESHVQHYHCDNGHFADNAFIADCEQNKQHITYCEVNAHFQNDIAEWVIGDIQDQAWKELLHARVRWPEVMHVALWPHAFRYAAYTHNTVPYQDDGHSRLELFAGIRCGTKMKENHTYGFSVFALQHWSK